MLDIFTLKFFVHVKKVLPMNYEIKVKTTI